MINLLKKDFVARFSNNLIIMLLGAILSFLLSAYLVNELGINNFGKYIFLFSALTILMAPAHVGQTRILIREIVKKNIEEKHGQISSILSWNFALSFLALAIIISFILLDFFFFKIIFSRFEYKLNTIIFSILGFIIISINNLLLAIIRSVKYVSLSQLIDVVIRPFSFIFLIFFFLTNTSYQSDTISEIFFLLMISSIFCFSLSLISIFYLFQQNKLELKPKLSVINTKPLFNALLMFSIIFVLDIINKNINTILLGFLGNEVDISWLQIANKFTLISLIPFTVLTKINQPFIVEALTISTNKLKSIANQITIISLLLSSLYLIAFVIFGEKIIEIFFNNSFEKSYQLAIVLIISKIIYISFGPSLVLLMMSKNEEFVLKIILFSVVINIIASSILISNFGVYGSVFGMSISTIIFGFLLQIKVKQNLKINISGIKNDIS